MNTPTDPTPAGKTPTQETTACEVPLIEQLRSVPIECREIIEVGYCHHRNIPYGALCHRAATELAAKDAELAQLREERESFHSDYRVKCDVETKALHAELATLRQQLADANAAFVGTDAACDHLRARLAASEQANAALRAEVERLKIEYNFNSGKLCSQRDAFKAAADRLAGALKIIEEEFADVQAENFADGAPPSLRINSRLNSVRVVLADYAKLLEGGKP